MRTPIGMANMRKTTAQNLGEEQHEQQAIEGGGRSSVSIDLKIFENRPDSELLIVGAKEGVVGRDVDPSV